MTERHTQRYVNKLLSQTVPARIVHLNLVKILKSKIKRRKQLFYNLIKKPNYKATVFQIL